MSFWYKAKESDIDVEMDMEEVHIFLYQDNLGAVYSSLTFKQIEDIYRKIHGSNKDN